MELLKLLLNRFFGFIACLVPGSVGFLLLMVHRPDLISEVWQAPLLTYETKLLISLLGSFAFGFSTTFLFSSTLTMIASAVGGALGPPKFLEPYPWEQSGWRRLLSLYLGDRAPEDLESPLPNEAFSKQLEAIKELPLNQRRDALADLSMKEEIAYRNHDEWFAWWLRFHEKSFYASSPSGRVYQTVVDSFYMASFLFVISAVFTPQFRLWWPLTISACWIVHFAAKLASTVWMARNPSLTLQSQVRFFQDQIEKTRQIKEFEDEV